MQNKHIIYFNPDYHLKNDIDRIALYSRQNVSSHSSKEWISYIHPVQAKIFMLFTKGRSWQENILILSQQFHIPPSKAEEIMTPYINNQEEIFTEYQGYRVYYPKNILIDSTILKGKEPHYDIDSSDIKIANTNINLEQDRLHKAPQSLLFMATNRCVTRCKYCYADRDSAYKEMTTEQILHFIDDAYRLKLSYIDVIGGEYFLRKDWDIILKSLVDRELTPTFISTKIPLKLNDIKRLKDTGYNRIVQISLDTLDHKHLKNTIHCWPSYLKELKETIHILSEYEFYLYIDTIITKHTTVEDIVALYKYLKTIKGLARWEIRVPEYTIYNSSNFTEIKPQKDIATQLCNFIQQNIIPSSPFEILVNDNALNNYFRSGKCSDLYFHGGTCSVLQSKCFILPDGKVSICERLFGHPQFIIGDLTKQNLEEIWQSTKAKQLFKLKQDFYSTDSICSNCKTFDFCTTAHRKCWVRTINAYGLQHWDYPDPYCCYAPPIITDMIYK